jgi:hypothetical protein
MGIDGLNSSRCFAGAKNPEITSTDSSKTGAMQRGGTRAAADATPRKLGVQPSFLAAFAHVDGHSKSGA